MPAAQAAAQMSIRGGVAATPIVIADGGAGDSNAIAGGGESALFDTSGLYSLTQVITISHRAAGVTSGDAEARVPGPASMALLGLGTAELGWARRRPS